MATESDSTTVEVLITENEVAVVESDGTEVLISHTDTVLEIFTEVADHGLLLGLADDDHPQYVSVSSSRTITAVHTFVNGFVSLDNLSATSVEFPLDPFTSSISSHKVVLLTDAPLQLLDSTLAVSAKYLITATDGTDFESTEIMVVVKDGIPYYTEFGKVATSSDLSLYSLSVSSGNLELYSSPNISGVTYVIVRTLIR